MLRPERIREFRRLLGERILVLDGAMGTVIQSYRLGRPTIAASASAMQPRDLKGNNDLLVLTRPDVIGEIHRRYLDSGADIIETNTFNSNAPSQADYGLESLVRELNLAAAQIARRAADEVAARTGRPRFVAGALGPDESHGVVVAEGQRSRATATSRSTNSWRRTPMATRALVDGGVDLILVETIFDTLNAKAALFAVRQVLDEAGVDLPIMISGTITDASGRTLSGQTVEAFWNSVRHARPAVDRPELRARREAAATVRRGAVAHRRCVRLRVSERRPAERVRRIRRDGLRDGRPGARIRDQRLRQHRRRLLRHDARTHPAHRASRSPGLPPRKPPRHRARAAA